VSQRVYAAISVVPIEVLVMLLVVNLVNASKGWYGAGQQAPRGSRSPKIAQTRTALFSHMNGEKRPTR